jgi:hypothetical protein
MYYKQNVYDPMDRKIGDIADVLVDRDGKVGVFIISVGGFLGIASKDVRYLSRQLRRRKRTEAGS